MSAKGYLDTIMDEVCYMCNRGTTCEECGSFLVIKTAIAEAKLEAVEKYISEHMLDSKRWCEGRSHNYTEKYLAELRKAAGKGKR